jgi:hypothetical protein
MRMLLCLIGILGLAGSANAVIVVFDEGFDSGLPAGWDLSGNALITGDGSDTYLSLPYEVSGAVNTAVFIDLAEYDVPTVMEYDTITVSANYNTDGGLLNFGSYNVALVHDSGPTLEGYLPNWESVISLGQWEEANFSWTVTEPATTPTHLYIYGPNAAYGDVTPQASFNLNDLSLSITHIPEPSTYAVFCCFGLLAFAIIRRKLMKAKATGARKNVAVG